MATDLLAESRADLAPELSRPPDRGAEIVGRVVSKRPPLTEEALDVAMYERLQKAKRAEPLPALDAPGMKMSSEQLTAMQLRDDKETLQSYKARRLSRGEQPFQYLPAAKAKQDNAAFREQLPFFTTLFAGPEKFAEAFPADQRQAVEDRFKHSLQPSAEKMATANKLLFETMTGQPVDDVLWPAQRSAYARERLGYEGASRMIGGGDPSIATAMVDDATFYSLAGKKLGEQQIEIDTTKKVADLARAHAIRGKGLGDAIAAAKEAAGPDWKKYESAAREGYAGVLSEFDDRTIETARGLFEFTAKMEGMDAEKVAGEFAKSQMFQQYGKADQATRNQMMQLLGLQAEAEGITVENYFKQFFGRVAGDLDRNGKMLASGSYRREAEDARELLKRGVLPAKMSPLAGTSPGGLLNMLDLFGEKNAIETRPMDAADRETWETYANETEGYAAFLTDSETAGIKVRDYITHRREGFWGTLADTTLMMAGSLPTMAMAAVPYGGGIVLVANSYAEQNLSTLRRQSPDADPETLKAMAFTSGFVEAGIDRLQILTLGAKTPKLNAALLKYGKPGLAGVIGVQGLVKGAAETVQEVGQDLTLSQVQQFASAVADDIEGPDWQAVMKREWEALGDIALVSFGFGIIGGAGSSITDYIAAPKLRETLQDRDGMELAGIDPATVATIADLAENNPAAAAETLKAAMMETPVEQRAANSKAALARLEGEAAMTTGNADAGLPVLSKLDDGRVEITYPDRAAETVAGPEEALEAVRSWEQEADVSVTQANRQMIGFLEDYHSSSPDTAFRGEQTGRKVTLGDWAGNSRERTAQAMARVQIMLRQAGQDMGGIDLSQIPILGSSQNQTARGITSIVAKINDGGNPLTVIEEHAEGVAKWLMETAKVPEAKMIGWIRETEQKLGKPLLSDNLLDIEPSARAQEIVEAWSYLAQANAAGRVADSALPRGVKAFFRAFKEFIHTALRIISEFAKLRADGQLDPEMTYWLDVAAGINEEFETENLNRQMEAELEREAMSGLPEIQETLAGELPHPDTPGVMFRGELRAIYDGIFNNPESGANQAARTRKANAFFRPLGESVDLDDVRVRANAKGFDFATPAEMLEAADLSVNFGKAQYGFTSPEGGESFSIAPSSPERDARPIEPVVIPDDALAGGKGDWHRAVRDFIRTNLFGKVLVNGDSGHEIKFTGRSEREAPSKLRKETGFRSAMEIPAITESAIRLGDTAARKGMEGQYSLVDYFAMPVIIGGKKAVAWFNALRPKEAGPSVFHEFGLIEEKKRPGLPEESLPPEGLASSKSGPETTVGEFIAEIKDTLPAAIKVAGDESFSIGADPAFYSQLTRTISAKVPNNATPAQILATVDPSRGSGVKAEEIKWSGLELAVERLAAENGGKVPKAALLEHLRNEGAVQFIETANDANPEDLREAQLEHEAAESDNIRVRNLAMDALEAGGAGRVAQLNIVDAIGNFRHVEGVDTEGAYRKALEIAPSFKWDDVLDAAIEEQNARERFNGVKQGSPRFSQYVLPGGENYREVVLSMPEQGRVTYTAENVVKIPGDDPEATHPGLFWYLRTPDNVFQILRSRFPEMEDARDYVIREKQPAAPGYKNFRSNHFPDVPNYIAHYRTTDREDGGGADGLFIEEIQSDRHQQARAKGYAPTTIFRVLDESGQLVAQNPVRENAEAIAAIGNRTIEAVQDDGVGIADAPFRKDWPLQMFKRALRDAVAAGKEWIGWTTGQTQAQRFDLSKQLDALVIDRTSAGGYVVQMKPKGSREFQQAGERGMNATALADTIGKDLATQVLDSDQDRVEFKGEGLKIGGEGMRGFYDTMLPAEIGKYVKKWGGKVEAGEVETSRQYPDWKPVTVSIHRVEITDAMRESVAAGQTSFALSLPSDPLLAAIAARIQLPEKNAEAFQKMWDRVKEVKGRFETARLSAAFNTDEKFDRVRFEQARDLAVLEAVARSLPPELRGKLAGSFRKVAELRTTKARGEYIQDLIPKIEAALEKHIAGQFRMAIRREMERGAIKVSEARTRGGKIGAAGHAIFEQAKKAMTFTPGEADVIAEQLTAQIEAAGPMTMERLEELDGMRAATELFADYENADSVRLQEALSLLQGVYAEGRKEWLEVLMGRRMLREDRVAKLREGLGLTTVTDTGEKKPVHIARGDRTRAKRAGEGTASALSETIMAAMLSGSQKIRRLGELTDDPAVRAITEQMEQAFATAENVEADRNAADNVALADAMRSIFKVSTEYGLAKKLRALSDSSKDAPVDTVEGFREEDVKVPKAIVDSLIRRESSGFKDPAGNRVELDEMDLAALEKAWEQFQELDDKKQAARKLITFTRRTAKGERKGLGPLSMLEGLQLWLTMRQPDQGTKLEAMGYDAKTREQLEAWLPADVQELGLWMVEHIGKDAYTTDTLHRLEKGVGLPLVDQYFPVRNNVSRSDNTGLALDGQSPQQSGRNVSFIKERVQNQAEPAIVNALAVFLAHRAQSNFWLSHVTPLREWGGVLRDESFADAVRTRMGDKYFASLQQLLKRIESGGSLAAGQVNDFERVVKRMMKGFAQGTLGLRVSTLLVNTSAVLNATFEVPAGTLLRGMMEVAKRPEAFADAWKSPAIQRRIRDGATFETTLAKSSGPSTIPLLALLESLGEKGVAPINYIDTGANTIAAAAVWEHTRNQALRAGLSQEEAKAAADQKVEVVLRRTAQPTGRLARSEIEQRALDNPLSALFALFISEPRKNFALTYMAARELLTGKGTYGKAMATQQLAMGLVTYAAVEFTIRSFYAAWAGAKDDEEDTVWERYKARMLDPKAWGMKLTTGHLTGVPVFGQGWAAAMAYAFDQPVMDASPNPLFKGVAAVPKLATALGKDDDEGNNPEASERIEGTIKAAQGLGTVLPGGAFFAQLGNVADFGEGVIETEAEKLDRYKARFAKFSKELPKPVKLDPAAGDDAKKAHSKADAARLEQNNRLKADWLKGELAPLTPARRKQVLDAIDPSESLRKLLPD